ncbi:hypothetical protein HK405_012702 [Cladochytrium tenue]|nr:hypothetical protein HK405_012702 [Cladochytrium tenue]
MFTKQEKGADPDADAVGEGVPPAAVLAATSAAVAAHAAKSAEPLLPASPLPLPPPPHLPHHPALQYAGGDGGYAIHRPPNHTRSKSHSHSPDHAGAAPHHASRLPRLGRTSWRPFQCTVDLDLVEFGAVPAADVVASAASSSRRPALRIKGRITLRIPRRVHDAAAVVISVSGEHWTDEAYIRGLVDPPPLLRHPPSLSSPSPLPQPPPLPPSPAVEFLKHEKVLWRRSQPTSFLPSGRNVFEFDEVVAATAPDGPLLPSVVLPQFAVDYQLSASIVRVLPDEGPGGAADSAAGAANFDLARTAKALLGISHAHAASLKTFPSDRAFTDDLLRDPSQFEVWLFNIPIYVPAKDLASAPLFLPNLRVDRPVTSTSKARPGIKIARGTSTFGLFDYELTMPKLVCVDQEKVNLILQLRPSAPSQTVAAVPLVGCSLVEKRTYNLETPVANVQGTYPSVVGDPQEHRDERPYEANFVAPSSASSKSASQSSLKSFLSGRNGKKKPSFSIQTSKIRSFSSSAPKSPLPSARPPSRDANEGYGGRSDEPDKSLFKRSMSLTRAPSRKSNLTPEPIDERQPSAPTGQAHVAFYPDNHSVHGDEVTIVESFTLGPEIEYTLEASRAQIISKAVHLSPGPTPLRWKLFAPPLRPIRGSFSGEDEWAKGADVGEEPPSQQRVVSRSPVSKMRSRSNPNFALTLHGEETGFVRGSTLRKASNPTLKEMLTRAPSVLRSASAGSDRDRSRSPSLSGIGGAASSTIIMRGNEALNGDAPARSLADVGSGPFTSFFSPAIANRASTAIPRGPSPAGAAPVHSYSSASLVGNPLPHEHLFILSFQPRLHASTAEPRLSKAPAPNPPSTPDGEDTDDQAFSLAAFLQTAPPPRQSDVAAKGLTGSVGVGHAGVDHPGTASIMPDIKGFRGFEVSHSVLIRVWFAPVAGLGGSGDRVARPVGHRETALACLGGVADVSVRPATGTFAARTFREDWIEVSIPVYSSL